METRVTETLIVRQGAVIPLQYVVLFVILLSRLVVRTCDETLAIKPKGKTSVLCSHLLRQCKKEVIVFALNFGNSESVHWKTSSSPIVSVAIAVASIYSTIAHLRYDWIS